MFGRTHVRVYTLWNLVAGLPPGARSRRKLGEDEQWTTSEKLAALTVEGLDQLAYLWVKTYSKKGTRIPDPVHIAWPGRKSKRTPTRVVVNQAPPETMNATMRGLVAGKIKRVPRGA